MDTKQTDRQDQSQARSLKKHISDDTVALPNTAPLKLTRCPNKNHSPNFVVESYKETENINEPIVRITPGDSLAF